MKCDSGRAPPSVRVGRRAEGSQASFLRTSPQTAGRRSTEESTSLGLRTSGGEENGSIAQGLGKTGHISGENRAYSRIGAHGRDGRCHEEALRFLKGRGREHLSSCCAFLTRPVADQRRRRQALSSSGSSEGSGSSENPYRQKRRRCPSDYPHGRAGEYTACSRAWRLRAG